MAIILKITLMWGNFHSFNELKFAIADYLLIFNEL